ncbi:MAG: ATP-dependent sacrificial sulfur transferase LarE [Phycisphaerales bacterium]|nr:MAG: ATP-dependent sacrificial sulfur transferase LarE [Phycisphaerales bacterium]
MAEPTLDDKLDRIKDILRSLERVAVAFSAGVDSTFVLKVAVDTLGPENVLAVTGRSDSLPPDEFEAASQLADRFGARHVVIDTDEFDDPNYTSNPTNRCYYCKSNLYEHMGPVMRQHAMAHIVSGANADDAHDWRPGLQAAREHNVRAPAAEAGLTKQDIRDLSARLNLPTHDKPAMPCLSSRVPYGEEVTPEKLRMIGQGEAYLRKELGIADCRVRHHGSVARIEVPADQIERLARPDVRAALDHHFQSIGYRYVALDLRGFRSGALNEVIQARLAPPQT